MLVKDGVYGEFDIQESIIEDLEATTSMQRLKGIEQYGLPFHLYPIKGFSRYEHSIGVMLLLRKLGASLEEQIAGLLHDVSHTTFSHLIDWVIGDRTKEDYQDKNHLSAVKNPEISSILYFHGLKPERIADLSLFSLLENHAPDICADRLDYALREFKAWAQPDIVEKCVGSLINHDGKIVFSNKKSAKDFAMAYSKCQREHWGGPEWVIRYELFSQALKEGLSERIIKKDEFFTSTDKEIIEILAKSRNNKITRILNTLSSPLKLELADENAQFHIHKKFRYVDPPYLSGNRVTKLSSTDVDYDNHLKEQRRINDLGVRINILNGAF